jgi:hypothetical protein
MAEALGLESGTPPLLVERPVADDQLPLDETTDPDLSGEQPKVH